MWRVIRPTHHVTMAAGSRPPKEKCDQGPSCARGHAPELSRLLTAGYISSWLSWQLDAQRRWTVAVLLFVIMNLCISRAAELKPGIPTLKPAGIRTFQNESIKYYRYLNLDKESETLYIGAMNFVIRINNINNISRPDSVSITDRLNSSREFGSDYSICNSTFMSDVEYECQNHIRSVIPITGDQIRICGTSAHNPRIFLLNTDNFNQRAQDLFSASTRGLAICPPSPNATCNVLYVRRGNPGNKPVTYSATMMDFTTTNPVIYRPEITGFSALLRTEKGDTKWLNKPFFVQSFDVGEYIYFFFRENAIEYMNCGKAVYSRVARVCKSDLGGETVLESRFTTYFKARLNCSIPGNYPFYFNELYDVFRINDTFYGLFRTYKDGLFGSAVCAFTLEDIEKAFDGPFKEQRESTSIWQRVPSNRVPVPRPGLCTNNSKAIADDVLQFGKARPLMDYAVQMDKDQPVLFVQEVMYEKMVVLQRNESNIYMLATDTGAIHKAVSWLDSGSYAHKLITVWKDFAENEPVQQMKLYNDTLYLSTDNRVVQIPVQQCERYTYCTQCIQDPYCGWNNTNKKCVENKRGDLLQDVKASIPEAICTKACHDGTVQHEVKSPGYPIHLDCKSKCEPSGEIQWFINKRLIHIDEEKYFRTVNNSLIVFNVTKQDEGRYTCKSQSVVLKEHEVISKECNGPENCWQQEFKNWCQEFKRYQNEMDEWLKMKKSFKDNGCFSRG